MLTGILAHGECVLLIFSLSLPIAYTVTVYDHKSGTKRLVVMCENPSTKSAQNASLGDLVNSLSVAIHSFWSLSCVVFKAQKLARKGSTGLMPAWLSCLHVITTNHSFCVVFLSGGMLPTWSMLQMCIRSVQSLVRMH